jgi:hypothetical protein
MSRVRRPAVAGTFYPAAPEPLGAMVDRFLADAGGHPLAGRVRAVIAPHAGYVYSGPTAGHAFAALRAGIAAAKRVVVIGPSHFVAFRGIALAGADVFRTPLGDLPVDRLARTELAELPAAAIADRPHESEHAIEVELPLLQRLSAGFALVPLVVGRARPAEVAAVLRALWHDEALVVVSSDLSHYEPYASAQDHDARTADAIEAFEADGIRAEDACGHLAIAGLLLEASRRGLAIHRLDLRNSGDTAGPRDRVVGYGAWALTAPPPARQVAGGAGP